MSDVPPSPDEVSRRPSTRSIVQAVVLAAGLVGIGLAARAGADELDGSTLPPPWALVAVLALALAATAAAASAWAAALPEAPRAAARHAVYVSQLSKYLPVGGIAQAAAQLGLTASAGVPGATVAGAWVVATMAAAVAASFVGLPVALVSEAPGWLRALAAVAPLGAVFLHPSLLRWAFGLVERRVPRLGVDHSHVPAPPAVARCLGWSVLNHLAFASAYAVSVLSLTDGVPAWQVIAGAALAWLAGFLVVILPGGVGVREAVLVAVVPAPAAALLSASLVARLGLLAAESLLAAGATLRRRR